MTPQVSISRTWTAMGTLAAALILVAAASAAPPRTATITRIDQLGGRLEVAWTLPAAVVAFEIEVAVNPATKSDGSYLDANNVACLEPSQNTWVGSNRLRPGTYYVHVETIDQACSDVENRICLGWSPSAQATIPLPPTESQR
jgi:hypothetical protein